MKEYYELLGLDETATDAEIQNAYLSLKEKYKEERWLDGERGNEAAKMLNKLDVALEAIKTSRKEKKTNTDGQNAFEKVAELLKNNDVNEAQRCLDDFNERPAEWHYLQAVVFYKKNWSNDSKKQLEIALSIDPDNKKYVDAYSKLKQKMAYSERRFESMPNDQEYNKQMGGGSNDCMSMCITWCCINMLCNGCCR